MQLLVDQAPQARLENAPGLVRGPHRGLWHCTPKLGASPGLQRGVQSHRALLANPNHSNQLVRVPPR